MNAAAASELVSIAALFDDRARRIEDAADLLATRFATATWSGPAADRYRSVIVDRRNEMRSGADALRHAAAAARMAGGA